jgi:three-Cys-motif partner protein
MSGFWGDDSWRHIAYDTTGNLFGFEEKTANDTIAEAFQERLRNVAGFGYVPAPLPMRNSTNAVVYYLFFASPKETGAKIVTDIFARYRRQ